MVMGGIYGKCLSFITNNHSLIPYLNFLSSWVIIVGIQLIVPVAKLSGQRERLLTTVIYIDVVYAYFPLRGIVNMTFRPTLSHEYAGLLIAI